MSFNNKVVLVTGSSSGIGAAAVIQYAKEGAYVVIVGRNEAKLKAVEAECEKYGKKPLVVKADVSIDADVQRIVEETVKKYGKIDVLVNNAGISKNADIKSDNFMAIYDETMNVNLRGVVLITHLAIPYLIESKGNIVNISSVVGIRVGFPNMIPYHVSKAALNHFTRCTAMNLASHGIRVNSISPGPVKTDLLDNQTTKTWTWDILGDYTLLKRVSEPEEIADLILFLSSDKARGVTGSDFLSDNGISNTM